jgi:hypothetical protein
MPFSRSGYDPETLALLYRVFNELLAERQPVEAARSESLRADLARVLMDGIAAGHRDAESLKRHARDRLAPLS